MLDRAAPAGAALAPVSGIRRAASGHRDGGVLPRLASVQWGSSNFEVRAFEAQVSFLCHYEPQAARLLACFGTPESRSFPAGQFLWAGGNPRNLSDSAGIGNREIPRFPNWPGPGPGIAVPAPGTGNRGPAGGTVTPGVSWSGLGLGTPAGSTCPDTWPRAGPARWPRASASDRALASGWGPLKCHPRQAPHWALPASA